MGLGSLLNSVSNIASSASKGQDSSSYSLKNFLSDLSNNGVQVRSNFLAQYYGYTNIEYRIQDISIPGLKSNTGQLHYKGRTVEIPVNSEQEHEFQMTVLSDGEGRLYTQFRLIMRAQYGTGHYRNLPEIRNVMQSMVVSPLGDGNNTAGMKIYLNSIRFTQIGGLNFSSQSNDLLSFTVSGIANEIDFQYSNIEKKTGLLGGLDKVSSFLGKFG